MVDQVLPKEDRLYLDALSLNYLQPIRPSLYVEFNSDEFNSN